VGNKRKSRILHKQTDFNNLRKVGRRFSPNKWITINYTPNEAGYLRYGFTISSKVGTAVIRNKLKRWLREAIRESVKKGFDSKIDINVFLKPVGIDFYSNLKYLEVKIAVEQLRKHVR
jgi:ribonuclease P protein component